MEQRVPALAPSGPAPLAGYLASTPPAPSLTAAGRFVPSARQRSVLKAQISCVALSFAALVLVAAYIMVPLAMAVQFAVNMAVIAWAVAATVLIELFLLIIFIILKTEGRDQEYAPSNGLP